MNDVLNTKQRNKEESTNIITANHLDYSTIVEKSIEFTHSTTPFDLYKGFIFMFLSCFFKSIFSLLCKIILDNNPKLSSFHLLTFKAYFMLLITIIVCLFYFFYQKVNNMSSYVFILSRSNLNLIMLRSVLSVISISLTIFALKYSSISEVYSVYYVYPGIVILLSYLILNEKLRKFDFFCLFCSFVGVILIVRPESIFPSVEGVPKANIIIFLMVILGATLKAFEDIIIRNVGKDIHCIIVPSVYSIISIILFPIPLGLTVENSNLFPSMNYLDIMIIILIAIFSFVYQAFMTYAIQNENAGRVAMVNYFQVLFMFFSDIFIFHRQLIFLDILGTLLIFSLNFANGLNKALKRNCDLNKFKNKNHGQFIASQIL